MVYSHSEDKLLQEAFELQNLSRTAQRCRRTFPVLPPCFQVLRVPRNEPENSKLERRFSLRIQNETLRMYRHPNVTNLIQRIHRLKCLSILFKR